MTPTLERRLQEHGEMLIEMQKSWETPSHSEQREDKQRGLGWASFRRRDQPRVPTPKLKGLHLTCHIVRGQRREVVELHRRK